MKHKLVAGAVLIIGCAFGLATVQADPDSIVDCSGISRYSTDHRYTRGDTVWYSDGPYAFRAECGADKCFKPDDHDDPVVAPRKKWNVTGRCSQQASSLH